MHVKTFDQAFCTFEEKEDDGSGNLYYFNEIFDELFVFVEIDPKYWSKYMTPGNYQPFILRLTASKGNVPIKQSKKSVSFSYNGSDLNKCFVLFHFDVKWDTYKIKAELMKETRVIGTVLKTVDIGGGE
jgi:hypothetical protein